MTAPMGRPRNLRDALAGRYMAPAPAMTASPEMVDAATTVRNARREIRELTSIWRNAILSARKAVESDRSLSQEGQRAALAERVAAVQQAAAQAADNLRDRLELAKETILDQINYAIGEPEEGVEALLKRQAAWGRALRLIEAKRATIRGLIDRTEDPEELHALREEVTAWADSIGMDEPAQDALRLRVDRRFCDLAEDPDVDLAWQVWPETAGLDVLINVMVAEVGSSQPMTTWASVQSESEYAEAKAAWNAAMVAEAQATRGSRQS